MLRKQLANVSTRCSSHPQGESEATLLVSKQALIYSCTFKDIETQYIHDQTLPTLYHDCVTNKLALGLYLHLLHVHLRR